MTTQKRRSEHESATADPCIETCTEDPVFVEENGVRASFSNPRGSAIRKIKYDDCYNRSPDELKADYILGLPKKLDVIVELKGSDLKHAYIQVERTLERWKTVPIRYARIVCLIIYGRLEGSKRKAGRIPRMNSSNGAKERDFLYRNKTLLLIRESGSEQFKFNDFLRKSDAS